VLRLGRAATIALVALTQIAGSALPSVAQSPVPLKRDGLYTLDYLRYEEYFEYTNFVAIAPAVIGRFEDWPRGVI
jgi:hypothetical protein